VLCQQFVVSVNLLFESSFVVDEILDPLRLLPNESFEQLETANRERARPPACARDWPSASDSLVFRLHLQVVRRHDRSRSLSHVNDEIVTFVFDRLQRGQRRLVTLRGSFELCTKFIDLVSILFETRLGQLVLVQPRSIHVRRTRTDERTRSTQRQRLVLPSYSVAFLFDVVELRLQSTNLCIVTINNRQKTIEPFDGIVSVVRKQFGTFDGQSVDLVSDGLQSSFPFVVDLHEFVQR
jgi:hypothetical protein